MLGFLGAELQLYSIIRLTAWRGGVGLAKRDGFPHLARDTVNGQHVARHSELLGMADDGWVPPCTLLRTAYAEIDIGVPDHRGCQGFGGLLESRAIMQPERSNEPRPPVRNCWASAVPKQELCCPPISG